MDKKTAAQPDNGILFTGRKTWTLEPWKGMEESKGTLLSKRSHSQKATYLLDDTAAAAAKSLQSCPTLCDPIDIKPLTQGQIVSGKTDFRPFLSSWLQIKCRNLVKLFLDPYENLSCIFIVNHVWSKIWVLSLITCYVLHVLLRKPSELKICHFRVINNRMYIRGLPWWFRG